MVENLLEQILEELRDLNRQVSATNNAAQAKMGEADKFMQNIISSLPAGLMKEVR